MRMARDRPQSQRLGRFEPSADDIVGRIQLDALPGLRHEPVEALERAGRTAKTLLYPQLLMVFVAGFQQNELGRDLYPLQHQLKDSP